MNKVSSWLTVVLGLLIIILWIPSRVMAVEPILKVDPDDSPLVIRGTLDEKTTAFSGNVRLTISGGDEKDLRFLPLSVQNTGDASVVIDRSNVTVPAGTSLTNGQPRDVRVTVNNVTRTGDYTGQLKFLLSGQAEDKALKIELKLHIDAKPKVQPVSATMNIQMARCGKWICWFATRLLSKSVVREKWPVYLNNQTLIPVEVTDATILMRGDKTGNPISSGDISLKIPHELPANKVEPIDMTIHRNKLPPDRYQGTLRFKVKGSDDPVMVNLDLSVREGPIWPLVIIIIGIIVGRLARGMNTPEAQMQLRLLRRFYQLDADAQKVQNPDAKAYLEKLLEKIKTRIESARETEAELSKELDKIQGRIEDLAGLEEMERSLEGKDQALVSELKQKIADTRSALFINNEQEAKKLLEEIEKRRQQALQSKSIGGREAERFAGILNKLQVHRAKMAEWEAGKQPPSGWVKTKNKFAQLVAGFSGVRGISAEVRYWFVSPLLFGILLIVLVLLGLQTLYVNAGSTFGASGLYDYLGLFLWGVSADVAQRGLQNLQLPKLV